MSKKRSPNFTETEQHILLEEVEKNKSVLFSKLSNVTSNASRKKLWESNCIKINAASPSEHQRTVEEVRKKWTTYTSSVKKQAARFRRESNRTGGGPPPEALTPFQDKVVSIIGETPIEGISGALDTCPQYHQTSSSTYRLQTTHDSDSSDENESTCNINDVEQFEIQPPTKRHFNSSTKNVDNSGERLVEIERKRLEIEEQRLLQEKQRTDIEKERLKVEQQRLEVEREMLDVTCKRFILEKAKQQLYIAQLQATWPPTMNNPPSQQLPNKL